MAENRVLTASKNSSRPSALPGDTSHSDDVDAAMKLMQMLPLKPAYDRPSPHPKREQLLSADHPMLPLRQPRHLLVKRSSVKLGTLAVPNSTSSPHTGDREPQRRTRGARFVPIRSQRCAGFDNGRPVVTLDQARTRTRAVSPFDPTQTARELESLWVSWDSEQAPTFT